METTIMGYIYILALWGIYWGYIGMMKNKMETTFQGLGFRVWGLRV